MFRQTPKQREIMSVILAFIDAGEQPTVTQIKDKLTYGSRVHIGAIYCSVKFLIKHGMLESGGGRKWVAGEGETFKPTVLGYKVFKPAPVL